MGLNDLKIAGRAGPRQGPICAAPGPKAFYQCPALPRAAASQETKGPRGQRRNDIVGPSGLQVPKGGKHLRGTVCGMNDVHGMTLNSQCVGECPVREPNTAVARRFDLQERHKESDSHGCRFEPRLLGGYFPARGWHWDGDRPRSWQRPAALQIQPGPFIKMITECGSGQRA